MNKHQDEDQLCVAALSAFASQFGSSDQFTQLVMETLLEELMSQQTNYNKEQSLGK